MQTVLSTSLRIEQFIFQTFKFTTETTEFKTELDN